MNSLCLYSNRLQEYRQKHNELKAAVAKELGFKITREPIASETLNGGEKNSDQETGCRKEGEDGGSPAVENASERQQEGPAEKCLVESVAIANGHVEKTDTDGGDSEDSDRAAEVKLVNGESEVRATGEEAETSTANGEIKSDAAVDEVKSDEVNGEINGALDITTSPLVLKSKGTWADVVSKPAIVNGTGGKNTAVNGVADSVTANGVAEE